MAIPEWIFPDKCTCDGRCNDRLGIPNHPAGHCDGPARYLLGEKGDISLFLCRWCFAEISGELSSK